VISQTVPGAHTTALGIWVSNGGRHQLPAQAGYAHLLEHLWFKRTADHDTRALARRFEAMGGRVNAYTGREISALHGLVPSEDAAELAELFLSMLLAPRFDEQDLATERAVVLQEMAMIADDPDEAIEEWAIEQIWPDHAMGWPLLGRHQVLQEATAASLHDYARGLLCGGRLCVVAIGGIESDHFLNLCRPLASLPPGGTPVQPPPRFTQVRAVERCDVAQSHLLWAMPAPPVTHPDYPALLMADHLLGGGVSSRLFQELRERRGLVYAVHSRQELYSDTGLWLIQTACEPKHVHRCRAAVEACIRELIGLGPDLEEPEIARQHLRADLAIAEDDQEMRSERLAREALYLGRHPSLEERLTQLAQVTPEDIARVLRQAWTLTSYFEWSP
jgi:predicted Zn-dependent peptidase